MECGVLVSLEHLSHIFSLFSLFSRFFFLSCFWHFLIFFVSLSSFLSSSAIALVSRLSFRSFLASGNFFPSFRRSSIRGVFKQKLKRIMPFLLFLCTNNSNSDECAKRRAVVYIIVSSSREAALCVRVCARESKRERACDTTFLKRKKMYGKEFGSESNRETEKIRLLFSRERARERESFRGFSKAKNRERRSRWRCVCGRFK